MKSYTYEARDEKPAEEKPRGTAIFSARRLARQQTGFEQFMAVVLLFVSVIGSTIAGGGGVERWAAGQFLAVCAILRSVRVLCAVDELAVPCRRCRLAHAHVDRVLALGTPVARGRADLG
jgi:hypothetical protein